jgi:hypothetical protein
MEAQAGPFCLGHGDDHRKLKLLRLPRSPRQGRRAHLQLCQREHGGLHHPAIVEPGQRWRCGGQPFEPRKLSVPPGYKSNKRQGYPEEQECGGGKYIGEWDSRTVYSGVCESAGKCLCVRTRHVYAPRLRAAPFWSAPQRRRAGLCGAQIRLRARSLSLPLPRRPLGHGVADHDGSRRPAAVAEMSSTRSTTKQTTRLGLQARCRRAIHPTCRCREARAIRAQPARLESIGTLHMTTMKSNLVTVEHNIPIIKMGVSPCGPAYIFLRRSKCMDCGCASICTVAAQARSLGSPCPWHGWRD